jgi:catechol 2,3-dioxygenase-like lactoylglutathione lyase family enzyme
VRDVGAAYARLCQSQAWSSISRHGPQTLPPSSGGATAFKFRSPEGHPIELISAEAGDIPRIDHSAISVADAAASADFYASFGLRRGAHSHNQGPEQARLDDLPDANVEVLALLPPEGATHLELLGYRTGHMRTQPLAALGDVAATRLVFAADAAAIEALSRRPGLERGGPSPLLRDPDGHLLQLEPPPPCPTARTGGRAAGRPPRVRG